MKKEKTVSLKELLDLRISDVVRIQDGVQALRVPGGWIYYSQATADSNLVQTFVQEPFRVDYDRRILEELGNGRREVVRAVMWSFGILAAFIILLK